MPAFPGETCPERPLFGGALSSCFPTRFQDVSDIRQVPNHQEAFVDPARDESLIFELLDFKHEVEDNATAVWYLRNLASEQDAEENVVIEHTASIEAVYRDAPAIISTAIGQMTVSKGRQGPEARNIIRVYLANLRLKEVATDVLITSYEPIFIKLKPLCCLDSVNWSVKMTSAPR